MSIISVDFDDTILQTMQAILQMQNNIIFGRVLYKQDLQDIFFSKLDGMSHTKAQDLEMRDAFIQSDLHLQTPMYPHAQQQLQALQDAGHTLHIVTWRHEKHKKAIHTYLDTHLPWIFTDVHVCNTSLPHEITKKERYERLWVSYIIDDSRRQVTWAVQKLWVQGFIMDQQRNQSYANDLPWAQRVHWRQDSAFAQIS